MKAVRAIHRKAKKQHQLKEKMSTLHARIESANRTAKQWESDGALSAEIRASIPLRELVPELVCENERNWSAYLADDDGAKAGDDSTAGEGPVRYKSDWFKDDDGEWDGDDLLLKRLTLYFKLEVMQWCDKPACSNPDCAGKADGHQMEPKETRGPETDEEKAGQASRVEVYNCTLCGQEETFPRYNSPRALFASRRGRCGEFANLFGTYCRSLGFDTRYILDLTDHVWVEIWSVGQQRWIHADACEGVIDSPAMYEQGWGKDLNYVIAATHDSVADVTRRYTRKLNTDDFLARRREYSPNERTSDRAFVQLNATIRSISNVGKGRAEELDRHSADEVQYFTAVQSSSGWDTEYKEGRRSGSTAWRAARRELGDGRSDEKEESGADKDRNETQSLFVECFLPRPSDRPGSLTIVVQPPSPSQHGHAGSTLDCIRVNGVPCAVGVQGSVSAVVVDDRSGCILQAKAFTQFSSAGSFFDTVPDGRIVAVCYCRKDAEDNEEKKMNGTAADSFRRLGGFDVTEASSNDCLMFVGQLSFRPKWATSLTDTTQSIKASIQLVPSEVAKRLRTEKNTVPSTVAARLPDNFMPLKTQLAVSEFQKRAAFYAYATEERSNSNGVGYCTRKGAPVYLLDDKSFPFQPAGGSSRMLTGPCWTVSHYLPSYLVEEDDEITEDEGQKKAPAAFDIPVTDAHFAGLLGQQLLSKMSSSSSPASAVDTAAALSNTRLVALYFSAHWCGPCRSFTPLLIEFYHVLKEAHPTHGLEIVFVSSDRDEPSFGQYYGSMPFLGLPFSDRSSAQQTKSVFGVRGIPSLVVLDSITGQIVVPPDKSRQMVHQACQQGEEAIERLYQTWLDMTPAESKSTMEILALSSEQAALDHNSTKEETTKSKADQYLTRETIQPKIPLNQEEVTQRVKELFAELTTEGLSPNAAAAEAIKRATEEQKRPSAPTEEGPLEGSSEIISVEGNAERASLKAAADRMLRGDSPDESDAGAILATAKKYVDNALKDPRNPRFRSFRLSNKVFDRITAEPGGVELIESLGFSTYHSDQDFYACLPLATDLNALAKVLDSMIKEHS